MFHLSYTNFQRFFTSLFLPGVLLLNGCSKVKIDQRTGNLVTNQQMAASRTRLVNLYGFTDLYINGQLLTDGKKAKSPEDVLTPSPTPYFPTSGKMTKTFFIPQQFFTSGDTAAVDMVNFGIPGSGQSADFNERFTAIDNYNQPNDYYVVRYRDGSPASATLSFTDSLFVFPRTISAAADPTHIKIRLINLSSGPDDAKLLGNMTLAFADGSPVNSATNNIFTGKASDYIELPYGTYQFKVLTTDGRQVPGGPGGTGAVNRFTGIMDGFGVTFAPIQTYLPGGVYTLVVSATSGFTYPSAPQYTPTIENSFQVITDITPPANLDYGRIQAANAFPGAGSPFVLTVDGQQLGGSLSYDSATDYSILPSGSHYFALQDVHGQLLSQQLLTLNGGDNYTIWIYPDSVSRPALLFAQNNLSGNYTLPQGDGSDNTYNTISNNFPFWIRFLNFCPDLPSVTFTQNNGQLFNQLYTLSAACAQNLAPGQLPPQSLQYIMMVDSITAPILAFQSKPLIVPGDWLPTVAPLTYMNFISSPASAYPNGLPLGEPGVYTVALTGRYGAAANGSLPAKMIVIKHTK